MVVQLLDPGPETWRSTTFAATVNNVTDFVYGYERTAVMETSVWAAGASVNASWIKFLANTGDVATIVITRVGGGAITSAKIYPEDTGYTYTVANNTITLVLTVADANRCGLRIEINGDRKNTLRVFSVPFRPAPLSYVLWPDEERIVTGENVGTDIITFGAAHGFSLDQRIRVVKLGAAGALPTATGGNIAEYTDYYAIPQANPAELQLARTPGGAAIDLTGASTTTWALFPTSWSSGTALVFPSGTRHATNTPALYPIGKMFDLADNVTIYVEGGAVVSGGFDVRAAQHVTFYGDGLVAGTFTTPEAVNALPFLTKITNCMILGYDGTTWVYNNVVWNITFAVMPFYFNYEGVWALGNVQIVSPWYWENNGLGFSAKAVGQYQSQAVDCYSETGDDNCMIGEDNFADMTIRRCFFVNSAAASFNTCYWVYSDNGFETLVQDCHVVHLGLVDTSDYLAYPVKGGNAIVRAWSDGFEREKAQGRFFITFDNVKVWGPVASRWISAGNIPYPFNPAEAREQFGQVHNYIFKNFWLQEEPGQLSNIEGKDAINTPNHFFFVHCEIAGVPLSIRNYRDYFELNEFPHHFYFGGRIMTTQVDVCNLALSYIGNKAKVTSLSPPDGSNEVTQCNRFYSSSVEAVLKMHNWSFAMQKAQLTYVDTDEAYTGESDDPAWNYRYIIPSDYMHAVAILPDGAKNDYYVIGVKQPVDYAIKLDSDDVQRIYTNEPDAWLRYVSSLSATDPSQWDPLFKLAVSWHLASMLAGALIKGEQGANEADRCLRRMSQYLAEARSRDSSERQVTPTQGVSWIQARGYATQNFTWPPIIRN